MKSRFSQNAKILERLRFGISLTSADARAMLGCDRLAARIFDLRRVGWQIDTDFIYRNGKRFACYSISASALE